MSSRCCVCMTTGKCLRCPCARSGNPCVDCYARKHGVCQNGAPSSSSGSLPTLPTRHGQEEALPSPTSPASIESAKTTAILDTLQLEAIAVSSPSFQTSTTQGGTTPSDTSDTIVTTGIVHACDTAMVGDRTDIADHELLVHSSSSRSSTGCTNSSDTTVTTSTFEKARSMEWTSSTARSCPANTCSTHPSAVEDAVRTERVLTAAATNATRSTNIGFQWGDVRGDQFVSSLSRAHEEIVSWRRNLFSLPSGKMGTRFVSEIARLLNAYSCGGPFASCSIKCVMTMPALVLQKPSARSKSKDHITCLERRLQWWKDGDLYSLLREGRAIQGQLPAAHKLDHDETSARKGFVRLMLQGNVKGALKCLQGLSTGGLLDLNAELQMATLSFKSYGKSILTLHLLVLIPFCLAQST